MTTPNEITIKLTKDQFDMLNTRLKTVVANLAYFPRKLMRESATSTLVMNLDQFVGFKQALAALTDGEAFKFLDIFFDQGEEAALAIANQIQQDNQQRMIANASKQTGLPDLKEVTVQDIKKATKKATKPTVTKKRKA